MSIEIIHNQNYLFGICVPFVKHLFDEMSPVKLRPPLCDLYLTLSGKWLDLNKDICYAITNIFVINKSIFKVLHTVIGETLGTIFNSIIFSARSRTVHRLRPSGASEHAKAISWASNSPPNWISRGDVDRSLRSMAAERPSSTNLFF